MILKRLLADMKYQCINGNLDIDILDISTDSRDDCRNKAYFAIKGFSHNGHDYIRQAYENGAKAVIVSEEVKYPNFLTVIKVKDTKEALALASRTYFNYPDKRLITIGVTGTKGKTTTTYYIKSILEKAHIKCGLIGTIIIDDCQRTCDSKNTTPSSYEIYKAMSSIIEAGGKALVMEVSSQGVMEKRVFGMDFDYGVVTNISKDHIGENEHSSYEEYASYKGKFLSNCKTILFNGDHKGVKELLKEIHTAGKPVKSFGLKEGNDYLGRNIVRLRRKEYLGVGFSSGGREFLCMQPGLFSVYNGLAAIGIGRELDIDEDSIYKGLATCQVPGRCEQIQYLDRTVIVDYAHNAISLENILNELAHYDHGKIITVFGCGGQRDPMRRWEMGRTSALLSDITIVTTDNPRNEEPRKIIDQIVLAIKEKQGTYYVVENRKEAIEYAMEIGQKSDIIVISGKGHEKYQIIGDKTIHFDDKEVVENYIKEHSYENIYI